MQRQWVMHLCNSRCALVTQKLLNVYQITDSDDCKELRYHSQSHWSGHNA